jgi:hypothetical protein
MLAKGMSHKAFLLQRRCNFSYKAMLSKTQSGRNLSRGCILTFPTLSLHMIFKKCNLLTSPHKSHTGRVTATAAISFPEPAILGKEREALG